MSLGLTIGIISYVGSHTVIISSTDNGASTGNYDINFNSSINVNTDVTVYFTVYDDLGGTTSGQSVIIYSGTNTIEATGQTGNSGGLFSSLSIDSFSPTSNGNQTYST